MRLKPFTLALLMLSAPVLSAHADDSSPVPRGTYVWADEALTEIAPPVTPGEPIQPNGHNSNLIYLNRCDGGCTITPGLESSINNRSSILRQTAYISEFSGGAETWNRVVDCVRETYGPFNVQITDQDPGNTPHFEAIVGGFPEQAGMSRGVGGVAPFRCSVINNAITFSFANLYGGDVDQICWTVAQETAHAFGLEHEYLCQDPMTYLDNCGARKRFQDANAQCGEFQPRTCQCTGSAQNSYQRIISHFGPNDPTPPDVNITEPPEGAKLDPGFPIRVNAQDDIAVRSVEVFINGNSVGRADTQPYTFNAPPDISNGRMTIEAVATDNFGFKGSTTIEVQQGEPCGAPEDCKGVETCVDGRCVPGPGTPGGLGFGCVKHEDCISGMCGLDSDTGVCTEVCEVGNQGCPPGFGCLDSGDFGVCWPGYDDSSSGGCSLSGERAPTSALLLLGLAVMLTARRRRRG